MTADGEPARPSVPPSVWLTVEARLARCIEERGGPIPFAEFMEIALYALPSPRSQGGYYGGGTVRFGPGGDFFTSTELYSPDYGRGLARVIEEHWNALGRPAPFTVVEGGGGSGVLARDIIEGARESASGFREALRYVLLEISPALARRQAERTADLGTQVVLASAWSLPLAGLTGCFVSVELPDAFPFHRLLVSDGRLLEIHVGWDEQQGEFFETALTPSDPALEDYVRALGVTPPEGVEFSVCPPARRWMADLGRALVRGTVITIDYGYADRALIAGRGVPARYFGPRHEAGAFDITSDVDWTGLIEEGEAAGLELVSFEDEVDFTRGWGGFQFGVRGHGGRARYVLVQRTPGFQEPPNSG